MAKSTTFTGSDGNQDITDAANWNNGIPVPGDTVTISSDIGHSATGKTLSAANVTDDGNGHNIEGTIFVVTGTLDLTTSLSLVGTNDFSKVGTLILPGGYSVVPATSLTAANAALATKTSEAAAWKNLFQTRSDK